MVYLWLALGGAIGAVSRYAVSGWVLDRFGPSPAGTFAVNIVGSFLIGLFLVLTEERYLVSSSLRPLVAVGFLGSFTTFSTLSFETMALIEDGAWLGALLNSAGSLLCGLVVVWLGMMLARAI